MSYDSGEAKDVKKAKKQAKVLEDRFKRGMQKICQDVECRYVLAQFFDEAKVFHPDRAIPTPDHVFEHGRDSGMRQAGLWWMTHALLHDPEIIGKLQQDTDSPLKAMTEEDERRTSSSE